MAERVQLIGTVHPVKRIGAPIRIDVRIVGEIKTHREIADKGEGRENKAPIFRNDSPERHVKDCGGKPKEANWMRKENQRGNHPAGQPVTWPPAQERGEAQTAQANRESE